MIDELIEHLVLDSNNYARKRNFTKLIEKKDLIRMIMILFTMGLVPLPKIHLYWSSTGIHQQIYGNLFIRQLLSRDQFYYLLSNFHGDIDEAISILNTKFQKHWTLGKFIIADESLIPFKGRYQYRQHIPNKPHSTGIKMYGLADQYGFLWSFWIYQGPDGENTKPFFIVKNFMQQLSSKNHIIIADSFYGSLGLAQELNENGYKFVFSCKSDRPSALFSRKLHLGLKKGSWKYGVWKNEIFALSFWDSAKCNFLSNVYGAGNSIRPKIVEIYNKFKGGMDVADGYWNRYLVSF